MHRERNIHLFLINIICLVPAVVNGQYNTSTYIFKGCFFLDADYDVLPDLVSCADEVHSSCLNTCSPESPFCQSENMTVNLCFRVCANQNARFFGLHNGSECLCGGAFSPYDTNGVPMMLEGCDKECAGNSSQICGGTLRVFVYEIREPSSDCFHPGFVTVRSEIYPPQGQAEFHINDTLDYSSICQEPSILNGTAIISCSENGWTTPPLCAIRCARPDPVPYVYFEQDSRDRYGIGETVTFKCTADMTAAYSAVCDNRGLWKLPMDCPVTCSSGNLPAGGRLVGSPMLQDYAVGALVTFACRNDAASTYILVCDGSGTWNTSHVACSVTPSQTTVESGFRPQTLSTVAGRSETSPGIVGKGGRDRGWVIAVAIVVPLVTLAIVLLIFLCYRKIKEERDTDVPQVVLGYIKKTGTLGGTPRTEQASDRHEEENGEEAHDSPKKSKTLTNSLKSMKRQFVKRVTLNRNRPDLPPKKNPRKSISPSVASASESLYDSPREVKAKPSLSGAKHEYVDEAKRPSLPGKKVSELSLPPSLDGENDDDVFSNANDDRGDAKAGGLGMGKSNEMLDALMVEFDGRVNLGFDAVESSARSSPSLQLSSRDSPITEHAAIHHLQTRPNGTELETTGNSASTYDANVSELSLVAEVHHGNGGLESTEEQIPESSPNADPGHSELTPLTLLKIKINLESEPRGTHNIPSVESPQYANIGDPTIKSMTKSPSNSEQIDDLNEVNGSLDPRSSHYDTLGEPRPAPSSLANANGDAPPQVNGSGQMPGPESPQYATLDDVRREFTGSAGASVGVTSPPNHEYVNVGRGVSATSAAAPHLFHHPRPPSLPPDSP